jgi:rhodanese-related sulfurtransferase
MRRSISVTLCFVLLVLAISSPILAYVDISPAEAKQKIDAGEDLFILDVRQPEEYAQGYVPKAYSIPLGEVDQRLDEIPRDKQVLAVCALGGRSASAAQILDENGYENVLNMAGGTTAWIALPAYVNIKGMDLWDQLTAPDGFILDVRKADEYASEHIAGTISIPLDQLADRLDEIPKDKLITVIGKNDPEGAQAAEKLIEAGYTGIRSLEGGMLEWDLETAVSSKGKKVTTFAAIKTTPSE